jgi:hypothetical protein
MRVNYIFLLFFLSSFLSKHESFAQFNANTFSLKTDFITGSGTSNPQGIVSSDIDGDGKLDLIISNSSNTTISIFRNTGTPSNFSFASQLTFSVVGNPNFLTLSDIDGDGKNDIIVGVNTGTQFSIFRNTSTQGNINLATRIDVTANNVPASIVVGDLDGDNKQDLVAMNFSSNNISVYRNLSTSGNISLSAKSDIAVGNGPSSAVIYDIDGDGKNDVAVTNYNAATISVLKNNTTLLGNIILANNSTLTTPSNPNFMKCADMDGDGRLDLIFSNYSSNNISVFRNNSQTPGTIVFNSRVDFATGSGSSAPQGSAAVDINNDSKLDFVVVNRLNNTLSAFMNNSSPGSFSTSSFSTKFEYTLGSSPSDMFAADIDGDLRPDVVATNNGTNTFSVLRNLHLFSEPTVPATSMIFSSVQNTSMTVSFTKGNGSRRIVLARASNPVNSAPTDSTMYTSSTVFGSGSQIGSGNFVVYSDTGSTFTLTGLTNNTMYYFAVFEYNGVGGYANYLTSAFNFLTGNQSTANITFYYSKPTGNLDLLSTWGTNTNGTGTSPTNFSTPNAYYFVVNNSSPTLGGNLTITGGNTALSVGDGFNAYNLTIPTGITLTTDTFILKKNSTLTVNGTLAGAVNIFEDTTTAQFLGSSAQNLPTANYYNLITSSSLKTLNNGNVVIRNAFTMMSSINLNNYALMVGASTSQLGTLNYVSGTVYGGIMYRWFTTATNSGSSGLFPIGTSTFYRPVSISYTSAPSAGGSLGVSFSSTAPNNNGLPLIDFNTIPIITVNKAGRNGTWTLTPGTLAGGQFTASITAAGFMNINSFADLRLIRRNSSANAWTLNGTALATTGSNAVPVLSRTGMNAFGEFGIGGDSATNPLPLDMLSFNAHTASKDVNLIWQTANEINTDYFEVMRSTDLSGWEKIGTVATAGFYQGVSSYSYTDKNVFSAHPKHQTFYYQLKQNDKDGAFTYTPIVTVNRSINEAISVYPNPMEHMLTIATNQAVLHAEVISLAGAVLAQSDSNTIEVSALPIGIYFIRIQTAEGVYTQKIVK